MLRKRRVIAKTLVFPLKDRLRREVPRQLQQRREAHQRPLPVVGANLEEMIAVIPPDPEFDQCRDQFRDLGLFLRGSVGEERFTAAAAVQDLIGAGLQRKMTAVSLGEKSRLQFETATVVAVQPGETCAGVPQCVFAAGTLISQDFGNEITAGDHAAVFVHVLLALADMRYFQPLVAAGAGKKIVRWRSERVLIQKREHHSASSVAEVGLKFLLHGHFAIPYRCHCVLHHYPAGCLSSLSGPGTSAADRRHRRWKTKQYLSPLRCRERSNQ